MRTLLQTLRGVRHCATSTTMAKEGSEFSVLVPGSEFSVPVPGSEFSVPVPGSEFSVPVPGSEFSVPVPGSKFSVPVPGSKFSVPVPGSEFSVPVPWGRITGEVWGPDHGRPVMCLHGWADNCGSFSTLIPLLPKECRYVAVDLAGHGLSSHRPPGDFYSCLEYVADVRRVADALQLSKFSIIGHSMGGDIAAVFSALYPEMVDGLVLLDSLGFLPTDSKDLCQKTRKGMDEVLQFEKKTEQKRVYTYEKAAERLMAANPTLSEQSMHILLERGLVQVEGGFVFSRDLRVNFKNMLLPSLEQSLEMQLRVQSSILVVLAERGYKRIYVEPAQRKFTSALLQCFQERNHTVVTVPGHHHVHLNNPEVVAPFVSDFLRTKVLSQSNNGKHKL